MNRHNATVMSPEYEGLTEVFIADEAQAEIDELKKENKELKKKYSQMLHELASKLSQ